MKNNTNNFFIYIIRIFICICIIKLYLVTAAADMIDIFDKEAIKDFITAYINTEGFIIKYGSNYFYTNYINTKAFIIHFVNTNNWSVVLNTEMTPEQRAVIVLELFDAHVDKTISDFELNIVQNILVLFLSIFWSAFEPSSKQKNHRLK